MDIVILCVAAIVIQHFPILLSIVASCRGASVMLIYTLQSCTCLTCHHKSTRMEQHSVLEEDKCANSCVHECKCLIYNSLCGGLH